MKDVDAGLFPDEVAVLDRSKRLLEAGEIAPEAFRELVAAYEKLLFNAAKLVRLGDGAHKKLRKTQKALEDLTQAKSLFIASLSHEIRNALAGISGIGELMKLSPLDAENSRNVQDIMTTCDSILLLLNDALDHSRIEAGRMDIERIAFDPREVMRSALHLVEIRARDRGLAISGKAGRNVPPLVAGDPHRLQQVLLNLLSNAVKFTESGYVRVRMRVAEADEDRVRLVCEVADSGIGIEPAALGRLFAPYRQATASTSRRYGGTGLGLAICKRLVELMGGTIEADSKPGRGTRFRFSIPVERVAAPRVVDPFPKDAALRLRVLAADDNAVNRLLIERRLAALGCERAVCLEDGLQVLERLGVEAADQAQQATWDVLLLDIEMPRLDGLETARRIRRAEKKGRHFTSDGAPLAIVGMTAHAESEAREWCAAAGMEGHLLKPVRTEQLREALLAHARTAPPKRVQAS